MVKLSAKQTQAFDILENNSTTELLYGGAAGGGKDYFACVWHIYRRLTYPDTRGFIGRETYKSLMGSTYNTFLNVMDIMGVKMGVDCKFNGRTGELKWYNGSSTIFGYLERDSRDPNYNRLGSTEYTDVIINEAVECEERAVIMLKSRIRYNLEATGIYSINEEGERVYTPKLLLLSNPNHNWVKWRFIKKEDGTPVALRKTQAYIQATLFDNPNKNFRNTYLASLKEMSEYDQQRLIHGDWDAFPKLGGEFFDKLTPGHIGNVQYNPDMPIWVSVDNNVLPYIAVSVWHSNKEGKELIQIGEVCTPESTATNAGHKVAQYLKGIGHKGKVYVTGDPSTRARNTINEDKSTFIELFSQSIREGGYTTIMRMLSAPPSVYTSGDFVNQLLMGFDNWRITIGTTCTQSKIDYFSVKKDSDGSMLKEKTRNEYGATYEVNGHLSDTFRYFVIACCEGEYIRWKGRGNNYDFMKNYDFKMPKHTDNDVY